MKVYLFVQNIVCDSEDFGVKTDLFKTEGEALKYFNGVVKEEREIAKEGKFVIEKDEKYSFCAYLDGEYINEHTTNEIRVFEI